MKKYFLVTLLFCVAYLSKSQILISLLLGDKLNSPKIEFGVTGGLNVSTIAGLSNSDYYRTFNLGFYFDFKLKNPAWMINTGVLVKSNMGATNIPTYTLDMQSLDSAFSGGSVTRRLGYFYVPAILKYRFKNKFSISAGGQIGLMNKAYDEFQNSLKEEDDLRYKTKIINQYNRIDAGLVAGIGYRLMGGNGINLSIHGYYGLVDIEKDAAAPQRYNRSVYFNVGIPVGAAKANKEIKEENN